MDFATLYKRMMQATWSLYPYNRWGQNCSICSQLCRVYPKVSV
jgi:hypothetical protein